MSGQIAPSATCPFSGTNLQGLSRPNQIYWPLHKVRSLEIITTGVSTFVEVNGTKPQWLVSTATGTQIRYLPGKERVASFQIQTVLCHGGKRLSPHYHSHRSLSQTHPVSFSQTKPTFSLKHHITSHPRYSRHRHLGTATGRPVTGTVCVRV